MFFLCERKRADEIAAGLVGSDMWERDSHLAVNEWGGKNLAPRKAGLPGLAYYVIEVAHKEELLTIAQRAQEVDAPVKWLTSSQLEITDPDGIVTRIRLAR